MKTTFAVLFLLLGAVTVQAATITVCASGCNVTIIQAAFDNYDLAPGDVVEIRDSRTYLETIYWGSNDAGSSGNPVTLRAAAGQTPTINGSLSVRNVNYAKIGSSGYGVIKFIHPATGWLDGAILFSNSNYCTVENNDVHNIYDGNGIMLLNGSHHNTIQNNLVYNIGTSYFATGSQGTGILIYRNGSDNVIQNNEVYNCAHDQIQAGGSIGSETNVSRNQILNNYIHGGYGEGISCLHAYYCLVDGNFIYNTATVQTNLAKPSIQLTGSHNGSIRRNVIYDGHHYYAFEMSVYASNARVTGNYVYNNTVHTYGTSSSSAGGGSAVFLGGRTGTNVDNNKFYNNIFWNINYTGQDGFTGSPYSVFANNYAYMPAGMDWGSSLSELQSSSCGGHDFKNNILRSHSGAGYGSVWAYMDVGNSFRYDCSTSSLNTTLTNCASGNIESDPLFTSSPSGTPAWSSTWWHLQTGSPAVNKGIVVNDPNAAIGGWKQLTYNGSAPDIGAFESGAAGSEPLAPSNVRIVPQP